MAGQSVASASWLELAGAITYKVCCLLVAGQGAGAACLLLDRTLVLPACWWSVESETWQGTKSAAAVIAPQPVAGTDCVWAGHGTAFQ